MSKDYEQGVKDTEERMVELLEDKAFLQAVRFAESIFIGNEYDLTDWNTEKSLARAEAIKMIRGTQ